MDAPLKIFRVTVVDLQDATRSESLLGAAASDHDARCKVIDVIAQRRPDIINPRVMHVMTIGRKEF